MIPFTSSPLSSGTAIALRTPSAMIDWLANFLIIEKSTALVVPIDLASAFTIL